MLAHVQHHGVLGEHLPVHAFQPDHPRVFDHALHQQPAEALSLQRRAHDDGVFAAAPVAVAVQPHHAEHLPFASSIAMKAIARS